MNPQQKFDRPTLYVTDLDGTLLADNATLSDESKRRIEKIVAAGIPFTIATARAIQSTQPVFEGLELPLPVVTFNGAFISNLSDTSYELIHRIDEQWITPILEIGRNQNIVPFVSSNDGLVDHLYYPNDRNDGMDRYLAGRTAAQDPRLTEASSSERYLSEQIVCFTFIDRLQVVSDVKRELESREIGVAISLFENRYSPGWYWLMIRDTHANKGTTTRELMSRYGLENHRLVTFGDEMNDVDLLEQADFGIAVGNAVDELKSMANRVIGANSDDAVTGFVLRDAGIE